MSIRPDMILSDSDVRKIIRDVASGASSFEALQKLAPTSSSLGNALRICQAGMAAEPETSEFLAQAFVNCYLAGILRRLGIKEPAIDQGATTKTKD